MILPKTTIEKEVLADGGKFVFGVDEVGRGPLAGPVVAGAAWVSPRIFEKDFPEKKLIRDSKTLSEKQREEIFRFISESGDFCFGIGEVSNAMIDRLNILNATLLAMRIAVEEAMEKAKAKISNIKYQNICLLIDGNREIPKLKYEQRLFVKGDSRVFSIAVASICAKVHRDRIMREYHKKFPLYGFDRHKGYGTSRHMECLKKNGPCEIHRKSFGPVRDLCN
jgi:ribonuclease HII